MSCILATFESVVESWFWKHCPSSMPPCKPPLKCQSLWGIRTWTERRCFRIDLQLQFISFTALELSAGFATRCGRIVVPGELPMEMVLGMLRGYLGGIDLGKKGAFSAIQEMTWSCCQGTQFLHTSISCFRYSLIVNCAQVQFSRVHHKVWTEQAPCLLTLGDSVHCISPLKRRYCWFSRATWHVTAPTLLWEWSLSES